MPLTYDSVIQQILNELGAVLGSSASQADANFTAPPTPSTVIGPDFVPSMVEPALASTLSEIVECIASTPKHLERQRYGDVTGSLANLDDIPQTGSGGDRIIGVPRFVRDASDGKAVLPAPLDAVRSFTRFSSTVYNGFDTYLYAINDGRIEHTRPNVVMGVCVWARPTVFSGDIDCEEWHEGGLVQGSVAKLALKESMFRDLLDGANTAWLAHLAQIKAYGAPELYGKAQAAPSST
jgi:hypothetical protein